MRDVINRVINDTLLPKRLPMYHVGQHIIGKAPHVKNVKAIITKIYSQEYGQALIVGHNGAIKNIAFKDWRKGFNNG